MEQAWALEQHFWSLLLEGRSSVFYRKHMAADGFVVLPSRIVSRNELVADWVDRSIDVCKLSAPTYTVIEGGNVVLTYRVSVDAEWLPSYDAFITSLYAPAVQSWTLVFRSHTPTAGGFPF